jgi:dTDP-4-dehydrorhamnose 3,5-epimerase-like enzyme
LPAQPYLIQFETTGEPAEGYISSTQFATKLPFDLKRVFWTYNTPAGIIRGRHAHKVTEQVLVALNGQIRVELENGTTYKNEFILDNPATGLYLPPMYWANIHLSDSAILLSLTSTDFDEQDYIRDHKVFLEIVNQVN